MDRQARVCLNGWVDEQKDSVQSCEGGNKALEVRIIHNLSYHI